MFSAFLVFWYLCRLEKYDKELLVFRETNFFFVLSDGILFGIQTPFSIFYIITRSSLCCVLCAA